MNGHLAWYVARASGITAYFLVSAAVLWGLALSAKVFRRPRPAWMLDLHRFLGGAAVIFTLTHLVGLFLDQWAKFSLTELLVPFASHWKPGPVAWGIVAFYILVTVELTSLFMNRLPKKLWHGIHLTSVLLFVFATVHLFTAGSDRSDLWLQRGAIFVNSCAALLLVVRFSMQRDDSSSYDESDPREKARAARRAAIAAAKEKAGLVAATGAADRSPPTAREAAGTRSSSGGNPPDARTPARRRAGTIGRA